MTLIIKSPSVLKSAPVRWMDAAIRALGKHISPIRLRGLVS
jgi:hypothetical protein